MTEKKRLAALALLAAAVLVMACSLCFILSEADHDCIGEDCLVCSRISVLEHNARVFGYTAAACIAAAVTGCFIWILPSLKEGRIIRLSLVSLKVKLSN